jgi:NADP-dependent 3-hydroxy acid dehydrogenase YdfG
MHILTITAGYHNGSEPINRLARLANKKTPATTEVFLICRGSTKYVFSEMVNHTTKQVETLIGSLEATGLKLETLGIMKEKGGGCIINISSLASLKPKEGRSAYAASKGALNSFSDFIRVELGPHNIAVSTIYPGGINHTDIFRKAGIDRVITNGVDARVVARAIVFICTQPEGVNIPELSIESTGY